MFKKLSLITLFSLLAGCSNGQSVSNSSLCHYDKINLVMNNHLLTTEVACTNEQRSYGFMNRKSIPEDNGMIFFFTTPAQQTFWMKDTLIPLSIAFVDEHWKIVDIQEMKALDETTIISKEKALYAIEANKNWFSNRHIKVGDQVFILQ